MCMCIHVNMGAHSGWKVVSEIPRARVTTCLMWLLRTELQYSARTASALIGWNISPAPEEISWEENEWLTCHTEPSGDEISLWGSPRVSSVTSVRIPFSRRLETGRLVQLKINHMARAKPWNLPILRLLFCCCLPVFTSSSIGRPWTPPSCFLF